MNTQEEHIFGCTIFSCNSISQIHSVPNSLSSTLSNYILDTTFTFRIGERQLEFVSVPTFTLPSNNGLANAGESVRLLQRFGKHNVTSQA